jgi:hypothetical protein
MRARPTQLFYAATLPGAVTTRAVIRKAGESAKFRVPQASILEAEPVLAGTQALLLQETRQHSPEQVLEQSRRTVLVGIGQSGSAGRFSHAEMYQAAQTTR